MKALHSFYMTLIFLSISSVAMAGGHTEIAVSGEDVFKASCANCHDSLIGGFFSGAPSIEKKAAWAPLLPKGVEGLTQATISGIGKMAARGGCAECSDEDIRAAVEYIVEQTQ